MHPLYGATAAEDMRERLWRMVKGYREAADLLVEEAEDEPYRRSNLIYPIVFCYRHSLELGFKQLLEEHGQAVGGAPEHRDHKLGSIWPRCRKVIEYYNPHADAEPLDVIQTVVGEMSDVDRDSYSFRYASDTKGQRVELKIESIDLLQLRAAMAGIHNLLECVDLQIQSIFDGF